MQINKILFAVWAIICLCSCENEKDTILSPSKEQSGELMAMENEIILSPSNTINRVLSLAWLNTTPNIVSYSIQASGKEDFSSNVAESAEANSTRSYTGAELNALVKGLGITPDVASEVYFRLKSVKRNRGPLYSNTVKAIVTAYEIDMSSGTVLDKNMAETASILHSKDRDGIYSGFMYAASWLNIYLKEGDGTIWGNDGDDGTAFLLSDGSTKRWACWFPGVAGCYYVEFNTNNKRWSGLLIPSVEVSGSISAVMSFDATAIQWQTPVTAVSPTSLMVKIQGTGKLYGYDTGTSNSAAVDTPFAFSGNAENVIMGSTPGDITVDIPEAGEYTLVLDLSDPKTWKCYVRN